MIQSEQFPYMGFSSTSKSIYSSRFLMMGNARPTKVLPHHWASTLTISLVVFFKSTALLNQEIYWCSIRIRRRFFGSAIGFPDTKTNVGKEVLANSACTIKFARGSRSLHYYTVNCWRQSSCPDPSLQFYILNKIFFPNLVDTLFARLK